MRHVEKIPNIHLQFARNDTKSIQTRLNVESNGFFFFLETSKGQDDCLKMYKSVNVLENTNKY